MAGGGISIAEASMVSLLGDTSSLGSGVWYWCDVSQIAEVAERDHLHGG